MKFTGKGNRTKGAVFLTLAGVLIWPALALSQSPQNTPIQTNPDDPNSAFNDTNKAVDAAASGIPGSVEIAAPVREAAHGSHERMIVVDPKKEKERKESESKYHDPTFDGSGLFSDIKVAPAATPAPARISAPARSTRASAGGSFLGETKLSAGSSLGLGASESASPIPAASPTASPAKEQEESPSPTPTPSPTPSASPQD